MEQIQCEGCMHTDRCDEEKKSMLLHLRRIEGQVRGVQKMVDENKYCIDILNQVNAIDSSLRSFAQNLLEQHVKTCVYSGVKAGDESKLDELCEVLKKMVK